jgi:hypothetical protein
MDFNEMKFDDLAKIINKLDDNVHWKLVNSDEQSLMEFNRLLSLVKESQNWDKSRNWEKGEVLEDLAFFIFGRFQDVDVKKNYRPADNESDIEIQLSEKVRPVFMNDFIGPKIVSECKNKKSSTIDVGMVTKLAELIPTRGARFGVFISILGIGGYGWRYGEGKRKKILVKQELPIISFRLDELEKLYEGANFYTMIKQKVKALYDEVDDESPDFPPQGHMEYPKRMLEIASHQEKCGIITLDEGRDLRERIIKMYGKDCGF